MNPFAWDAPWIVVALGLFVIVMLRANGTYWLGRAIAAGTARTRARRVMESPGYLNATRWINTWGAPVVSVSFLTVGVQTLVNLAAGASKMPLRRYLPAVSIGCAVWAAIYATVGVLSWQAFLVVYRRWPVAAIVVAVAVLGVLAWYIVRQVRGARAGRVTAPLVSDQAPVQEPAQH